MAKAVHKKRAEKGSQLNVYIRWILAALAEQRGLKNRSGLAKALGISAPQITKMLNGDRNIRAEELTAISEYFGRPIPGIDGASLMPCRYIGEIGAGIWRDADNLSQDEEPHFVPMIPRPEYRGVDQFAGRVRGPSFNKIIQDGDYAVAVPYFVVRRAINHNDIVIVERRRGGTVERTIKKVKRDKTGSGWELWPESSDPKWKKPVPYIADVKKGQRSSVVVEIIGLVIGRYGSFG